MTFLMYLLNRAEWIAAFILVAILIFNCLTALEPTPRSHPIPISSKLPVINDGLHSVLVKHSTNVSVEPQHDASSNGVSHARLFIPTSQ